jgi:transposase-like protein
MRELDFATEPSIAEAFDELQENFEAEIEAEVERNTAETLNRLLVVDAERQLGAGLYERTLERVGYRCGSRPRRLVITKGTFDLRAPRARNMKLEFRLFERYRRLWKQVDGVLREAYIGGLSTRRTGEVLELVLGTRVSAQTVSRALKALTPLVERYHRRDLEDRYRVLLLDGVTQKIRGWRGRAVMKVALVAYGIGWDGRREIVDFMVAPAENEAAWWGFLNRLEKRGLEGEVLECVVSDGSPGLVKAIEYFYPRVKHQRCWAHKLRNVADKVKQCDQAAVLRDAKKIPTAPHRTAAVAAFRHWRNRWIDPYPQAVRCVEKDLEALLVCFDFPKELRKYIRTTNRIERSFKEVRRRTRPIGCFNNIESCERILYAVIVYLNAHWERKPLPQFAHNT